MRRRESSTRLEMRISVLMDIPLKKSREQLHCTFFFKPTNMTISFFIAMNAQILLNEKLIFKMNT